MRTDMAEHPQHVLRAMLSHGGEFLVAGYDLRPRQRGERAMTWSDCCNTWRSEQPGVATRRALAPGRLAAVRNRVVGCASASCSSRPRRSRPHARELAPVAGIAERAASLSPKEPPTGRWGHGLARPLPDTLGHALGGARRRRRRPASSAPVRRLKQQSRAGGCSGDFAEAETTRPRSAFGTWIDGTGEDE
jgi:hypothetical protein